MPDPAIIDGRPILKAKKARNSGEELRALVRLINPIALLLGSVHANQIPSLSGVSIHVNQRSRLVLR